MEETIYVSIHTPTHIHIESVYILYIECLFKEENE